MSIYTLIDGTSFQSPTSPLFSHLLVSEFKISRRCIVNGMNSFLRVVSTGLMKPSLSTDRNFQRPS